MNIYACVSAEASCLACHFHRLKATKSWASAWRSEMATMPCKLVHLMCCRTRYLLSIISDLTWFDVTVCQFRDLIYMFGISVTYILFPLHIFPISVKSPANAFHRIDHMSGPPQVSKPVLGQFRVHDLPPKRKLIEFRVSKEAVLPIGALTNQ